MPAAAYVVHRARGRLRLRIPEHRGDRVFFGGLQERLRALPGIASVTANPVTASMLFLLDPGSSRDPVHAIEAAGLLEIQDGPAPMPSALSALRRVSWRIDEALHAQTGGSLELRTLAFLLLVAFAVRQAARGQLLAPAASLLWYAFELLRFLPEDPGAMGAGKDQEGV